MSVPLAESGHPDARQDAPPPATEPEQLGEGHISGNIVFDPELRYTATGRAVVKLRIAYAPRVKNPDTNEWRDGPPEYYDLDIWGKQAEHVVEHLIRGDRIVAIGAWTKRTWTDREGQERTSYSLTVRDIGPSLLFREVTVHRPVKSASQDA